jgi:hypothetical protein
MISPPRRKVNRRGRKYASTGQAGTKQGKQNLFTGMDRVCRIKTISFLRVNQRQLNLFILSIPVEPVFEGFRVNNFAQ